jgi:hypothetical protein
MDNKDFKVRIIDFYKDVDKPIINDLYNDEKAKNVLELSTKTQFSLLKKNKNKWIIKDQRKLLKEIDSVKKKKVNEIKSSFTKLNNEDININELKDSNNKLIADLESIDNLKKNIDDNELYTKLQNLTLKNYKSKVRKEEKEQKSFKEKEQKNFKEKEQKGGFKEKEEKEEKEQKNVSKEIKIIDIQEKNYNQIKGYDSIPLRKSKVETKFESKFENININQNNNKDVSLFDVNKLSSESSDYIEIFSN